MQLKVDVKKIIGILLIYFMLLLNQTHFSENYLNKYAILIAVPTFLFLFIKSRILARWSAICCLALLIFSVFLRLSVGGVGLKSYSSICVLIVVSAYAVAYNKDNFLTLFLKTVVFLALVSILLWMFCIVFPDIYIDLTTTYETQMTYKIYSSSINYVERNYKASGLFFYTLREFDNRNTGIFTEPGVYQMVLNSALFVLLMLDKKLKNITVPMKRCYLFILIIALLTTQSTTGYIGGFLIILFYVLNSSKDHKTEKRVIFIAVVLVGLVLLCDYHFRGEESLIFVTLLKKLVTDSNMISISADASGVARWGTILISFQSMMKNPFGVGYDKFGYLLNTDKTGYVAAAILSFGAIWGVIPLIFVMWWVFYPVFKSQLLWQEKILYVLLYLNTTLAQSNVFYPTLIVIPIYLYANKKWRLKD